jgi:hypothetical protein
VTPCQPEAEEADLLRLAVVVVVFWKRDLVVVVVVVTRRLVLFLADLETGGHAVVVWRQRWCRDVDVPWMGWLTALSPPSEERAGWEGE